MTASQKALVLIAFIGVLIGIAIHMAYPNFELPAPFVQSDAVRTV